MTELYKAPGIGNNLEDTITGQAISGGVGSNRKLFSAVMRAGDENEYEDGNRPFHSADMIVHCWTELMSTAPKGCAPTRYRGWY